MFQVDLFFQAFTLRSKLSVPCSLHFLSSQGGPPIQFQNISISFQDLMSLPQNVPGQDPSMYST